MMNNPLTQKIVLTLILVLSVLLSHLNWLDNIAEEYTEQGIKRTLITYAVSRSLNGVISVAQGTEVALSPAGVGLTFTPGQILDPVNDLIERFSSVVMVSGASLGVQRLFLEITSSPVVVWLLSLLCFLYIVIIWLKAFKLNNNWKLWLKKSLVLIIFIRFSVPMIAVINEALYLSYLQPKYEVAQTQLENASSNIELINKASRREVQQSEDEGLLKKVEQWLDQTKKNLDVQTQMDSLKQAAANVSEQVINMIVVFLVQTIIFPLLFLWLLISGAKGIMYRMAL